MEDKLFEKLDDLNIKDTNLLLHKDIGLSLNSSIRKKIERSVMKRAGYYKESYTIKDKINNILGGILMKRKIALALSAAAVLTLGGGGYAYAAKTPVAYVSMDINPSVELGVNAFDKVVSVEAYNEDGKKILEGEVLINFNINEAINNLLENAISEGYVNEDGLSAIEITTATDKEDVAAELDESLQEVVDETLENNNVEAEVETENVALARRDEARGLGITPGKLNLIQKLQALDPSIKVEDYKDSSVKDIQKKAKELRKLNKSDDIVSDNSANTDTSTDTSIDADVNTDADTSSDVVSEENTLSQTSVEEDAAPVVKAEKNNNSSINKENNGINKKDENSNENKQKDAATIPEKQNNSNHVKSQGNGNSSKLEEDSKSNSNSQNKVNNKDKSN